ncbi:ricin-type beta-trefoil lectin domain protein [Kitasatospora phosalacinea]|uniref:ricin-type beta-trefoil lectin domain protein n=1 Tax=Kitasatospora phosalacinea TaxID=2065 RepID=UPI000AFE1B9F|nr:ricin-type beta-trefoil lectin domain protein [Kitasatospora phosalacinea]
MREPQLTDAPFTLKGADSGRCLDVPNGQTGVQVQIWDCSGNANQMITRTAVGELRVAGPASSGRSGWTAPWPTTPTDW